MVSTDPNLIQTHALIGEAMKALVEIGASAEVLGAFALSYPVKVEKLMARPPAVEDVPDLQAIITKSVKQAMQDAGMVPRKAPPKVRVYVLVDGKRTSVLIAQPVLQQLQEVKGADLAREVVQQLVEQAPEDIENRSAWLGQKIKGYLLLSQVQGSDAPRH